MKIIVRINLENDLIYILAGSRGFARFVPLSRGVTKHTFDPYRRNSFNNSETRFKIRFVVLEELVDKRQRDIFIIVYI